MSIPVKSFKKPMDSIFIIHIDIFINSNLEGVPSRSCPAVPCWPPSSPSKAREPRARRRPRRCWWRAPRGGRRIVERLAKQGGLAVPRSAAMGKKRFFHVTSRLNIWWNICAMVKRWILYTYWEIPIVGWMNINHVYIYISCFDHCIYGNNSGTSNFSDWILGKHPSQHMC